MKSSVRSNDLWRMSRGCLIGGRRTDPELASYLRLEERELEAGGLNSNAQSITQTGFERYRGVNSTAGRPPGSSSSR